MIGLPAATIEAPDTVDAEMRGLATAYDATMATLGQAQANATSIGERLTAATGDLETADRALAEARRNAVALGGSALPEPIALRAGLAAEVAELSAQRELAEQAIRDAAGAAETARTKLAVAQHRRDLSAAISAAAVNDAAVDAALGVLYDALDERDAIEATLRTGRPDEVQDAVFSWARIPSASRRHILI